MNDYSVTIETLKTGQYESYPLEQIVVCLGMDILNERILEKQRRDENWQYNQVRNNVGNILPNYHLNHIEHESRYAHERSRYR